MNAVYNNGYSF